MGQSLSSIILHIVFSTKNREAVILPLMQSHLHHAIRSHLRKENIRAYEVGGVADHIHIACELPRTMTTADLVKNIKLSSSKFLKDEYRLNFFHWQNGYGAFSVSASQRMQLEEYIRHQSEHHREHDFKSEFRFLLQKYSVDYDECYVWE